MAKRFRDSNIQDEDWYIILPMEYKLLWDFICDKCDHAGIWKPNLVKFTAFNATVDLEKALEHFNDDESDPRLIKLENGKFFLPGFFVFQYGPKLNLKNSVHLSISQIYYKNGVKQSSIKGLKEVTEGIKDKDKDKDNKKEPEIKNEIPEVKIPDPVEVKIIDKVFYPFETEKFKQAWVSWLSYRKDIGKKYKSLQSEQAALKQLSEFDEEFSIKLIENSISNGYQGLIFTSTTQDFHKYKNGKQSSNNKPGVSNSVDNLNSLTDAYYSAKQPAPRA